MKYILALLLIPMTAQAVPGAVQETVQGAREALESVLPTRELPEPRLSERAAAEISKHEVGSEQRYIRSYQRPVYPGYASGPTVGIGYDLGTQTAKTILDDWSAHKHHRRMATASGLLGETKARPWVAANQDIVVPWQLAVEIFRTRTIPKYYNQARNAFGREQFDRLPQGARDALTSLVFNRGPSMRGSRRVEMRAIRDFCVPAQDVECIARNIESQCYLWQGSRVYNGLCRRRKQEAQMARGL